MEETRVVLIYSEIAEPFELNDVVIEVFTQFRLEFTTIDNFSRRWIQIVNRFTGFLAGNFRRKEPLIQRDSPV
jgi:hypothetical protein